MAGFAKRPFVLIVRDGWGQNPHPEQDSYNAIKQARHPVDDRLMRDYPHVLVKTSGEDVGLPVGVMGNSEVGHQNIGAGRIVDQETMRITNRIRDGSFFQNKTLLEALAHAKKHNSTVHILGLCSDGRVHSDQEHAYAILEMAKQQAFTAAGDRVLIHAITDGRDTAPTGAARYLPALEAKCKEIGVGRIATVVGRFYAMDRDNRWERVQAAYELLTENKGEHYATASEALQHYYAHASDPSRGGDEFVVPSVIGAGGVIKDNDAVIFFNYRGDRPREITKAFVYDDAALAKEPNGGFARKVKPKNLYFATMAGYEEGLPVHVIFEKPEKMPEIFGALLAEHGLTQFRSAETEKFPHVTFFFNDYREPPFNHEDRGMAQSPKDVKTYDLKPEMAAYQVCDIVLKEIAQGTHDVYIVNFANGDMVGHTGKLPAAIKAVEVVDECVGKVVDAVLAKGGALIVTADHGNCEQMWDPVHNCPHTSHTTYDVPLIVVDPRFKGAKLKTGGRLAGCGAHGIEDDGLAPAQGDERDVTVIENAPVEADESEPSMSEPRSILPLEEEKSAPAAGAAPAVAPAGGSRWGRLFRGAAIGASHGAAILFTFIFWGVAQFVVYAVLGVMSVIHAMNGPAERPAPLMIPLLVVMWLIVGAIAGAAGGALIAALTAIVAICADAFRRSRGWPFWLMPVVVAAVNLLFWPLALLPFMAGAREAFGRGLAVAGGFTVLFLIYWGALFFAENLFGIGKWLFGRMWPRNRSPQGTAKKVGI